ncbi:enoyl-CoA hydratase-related protein [Phreatobacter stygius]|uniref:2-(1,2-epoxy-1,2-dihydrophenyl)acetyl-CoA isomerase n=1 Tax=Phreatobacter stygius TaxID=1940610 RepID=A0A4D7BFD7_9HYPH|nr:enoyl-CoA hydratase-related protein [Phreatobacter stygius]QCI66597.1 2-(1,2-epoxy-1,2-dihydrophenyl)acetyl-CoA isomerase [Phreatobacter stygius]
MSSKIDVSLSGSVAILRLNDPASMNALSVEMVEAMRAAVAEAARSARVLVLAGSARAFSSGANLTGGMVGEQAGSERDAGAILESHINPLMVALRDLNIPWIAAVRGAAAGVGCSLALAADLIVAGESAYFLQAFRRIGLVPDGGSTYLLVKAVGRVRAMEMMLLGEKIPADKALAWGLINRVVRDDMVEDTALALARDMAEGPTVALGLIRKSAWLATSADFETSLQAERNMQAEAGRTADFKEGVAAFRDKRPARFTGT